MGWTCGDKGLDGQVVLKHGGVKLNSGCRKISNATLFLNSLLVSSSNHQ